MVSHNTVIDPEWWDYLYKSDSAYILRNMMIASGKASYEDLLHTYEGYTIDQFVESVLLTIANGG